MDTQHIAGPSSSAAWVEMQVGVGAGRPLTVLLLPGVENQPRNGVAAPGEDHATYYYLPKAPVLVRDAAGKPVFSLTVRLSRRPTPADETIFPLIQQSTLALQLGLVLPDAALAELRRLRPGNYQPLFARAAAFTLQQGGKTIASAVDDTIGVEPSTGLSGDLNREDTLDLLKALDGVPSAIDACCKVQFRAAGGGEKIRLSGAWAAMHGFLKPQVDENGEIDRAAMAEYFATMIEASVLKATRQIGSGKEEPLTGDGATPMFERFLGLASLILERVTTDLDSANAQNRYLLLPRPNDLLRLNYAQTLTGSADRSSELSAPLEDIIGGALTGLDRDSFIHLFSAGGGARGDFGPVPVLVRSPGSGSREAGGASDDMALAATSDGFESMALTLRPNSTLALRADALSRSDMVSHEAGDDWEMAWVDDAVYEDPDEAPLRNLPLVDDSSKPIWQDRQDGRQYWYAPSFVPMQPQPNLDPADSPFLFTFSHAGATAGAELSLDGTVRLTLRQDMPAAARNALAALGNPTARAVEVRALSVNLLLPFKDQGSHADMTHSCQATVARSGEQVTATVTLADDWVRLCYGALAYQGFQPQPARVEVSYSFDAYVSAPPRPHIDYGGKWAVVQIIRKPDDWPEEIYSPIVDEQTLSVVRPEGKVRVELEPAVAPTTTVATTFVATNPLETATVLTHSTVLQPLSILTTPRVGYVQAMLLDMPQPSAGLALDVALFDTPPSKERDTFAASRPVAATLTVQPQIEIAGVVETQLKRTRYVTRSVLHGETHDVLYPCDTLGAFYLQTTDLGSESVGCQDALRLGETQYREYKEVPELAGPGQPARYRVYRSLVQPGRFLVLPTDYVITRYAPSEGQRAYRPVLLLYSVEDAAHPENRRFLVSASLQPDLPPGFMRELTTKLKNLAHDPLIEFPTEIESTVSYAWTIDSTVQVTPLAVKGPDCFQVSLSTDLAGAHLLHVIVENNGLVGAATFALPDGTHLESRLLLRLDRITGPWETGPVQVELQAGGAKLTNRIYQPVNVTDLAVYYGPGPGNATPVEKLMPPGATVQTALSGAASEAYAQYSMPEGNLPKMEEVHSFIEDVRINLAFLNTVIYSNHPGLRKLALEVWIKGYRETLGSQRVALSEENRVGEAILNLPLTTYVTDPVMQFVVTRTFDAGESIVGPFDWPYRSKGAVIDINWELIGS